MKKNKNQNSDIDVAEIAHSEKRTHFTVESSNTKPIDIQLMTGKPSGNGDPDNKEGVDINEINLNNLVRNPISFS